MSTPTENTLYTGLFHQNNPFNRDLSLHFSGLWLISVFAPLFYPKKREKWQPEAHQCPPKRSRRRIGGWDDGLNTLIDVIDYRGRLGMYYRAAGSLHPSHRQRAITGLCPLFFYPIRSHHYRTVYTAEGSIKKKKIESSLLFVHYDRSARNCSRGIGILCYTYLVIIYQSSGCLIRNFNAECVGSFAIIDC